MNSSPPLSPSLCPGARPALLTRSCGVGAGRRFCGASWMHGYPAVQEGEVDVMLVSCQRLLKYIIYEILHRKGRKANLTESFAVRYQ